MNAVPVTSPRPARGVALVSALMLMLVASVLAVAAGRMALAQLNAAQWERDRAVARGAAGAALCDAERTLEAAPDAELARLAVLADDAAGAPAWQVVDPAGTGAGLVAYGQQTGARMALGGGLLPARLPAWLAERIAEPDAGPERGPLFRITAIGFGTRAATEVVVQGLYRLRPAASADASADEAPPAVRTGRIGWREIANWPELHARAGSAR
jgi:type IV pilus assembly protein PilX